MPVSDASLQSYLHETNSFQVGRAIPLERSKIQWVDLGDVSGNSCFSVPETCGPNGGSLTAWINLIDCPPGSGFMSSILVKRSTGFLASCNSKGLQWEN